ncbi:MAG: hypothetical protein WBF33_28365 [Candidatus Nitrosopolaris sp.]
MTEEQFQKVANKKDLQEGSLLKGEDKGKQIVLSMFEGKIYAIDEICTYEGGPFTYSTTTGVHSKQQPYLLHIWP